MALSMAGHMIEWFSAEVIDDGEVIFQTDSRDELIAWANSHKDLASATYSAIYSMTDGNSEQEDVGPVADLIDWPELDEQFSEYELDWQNAGQGPG